MKLVELLTSSYSWTGLEKISSTSYTAFFQDDDGNDIEVILNKVRRAIDVWDIEFSRDGTYSMTGQGDAIKIFGTVLEIIKEFTEAVDPEYIIFSSKNDETSRIKFYKRFTKKIEAFGYKDVSDDIETLEPKVQEYIAEYQKNFTQNTLFVLARKDLLA